MKLNHHPITPDEIKVLALQYLETEKQFTQNRMDAIDNQIKQLKLHPPSATVSQAPDTDSGSDDKGRRLSSAARQRISEAQKERWAKVRKEAKRAEKAPAKRRSRAIAAGQAASPASDPEE